MPRFTFTQRFTVPRERVFAFFRSPVNRLAVAAPGLQLTLLEAPSELQQGVRLHVATWRWGISLKMITEVLEFVEPAWIIEEQRQGPFRSWRHEMRFLAPNPDETELVDIIDFEPPSGMLGLTMTAARIQADLHEAYQWRQDKLSELLGG